MVKRIIILISILLFANIASAQTLDLTHTYGKLFNTSFGAYTTTSATGLELNAGSFTFGAAIWSDNEDFRGQDLTITWTKIIKRFTLVLDYGKFMTNGYETDNVYYVSGRFRLFGK